MKILWGVCRTSPKLYLKISQFMAQKNMSLWTQFIMYTCIHGTSVICTPSIYIHAKCLVCVISKKYIQYDLFKKYTYHEVMRQWNALPTDWKLSIFVASPPLKPFPLSTFPHGSSRNSPLVLKPPWSSLFLGGQKSALGLCTPKRRVALKKNGD